MAEAPKSTMQPSKAAKKKLKKAPWVLRYGSAQSRTLRTATFSKTPEKHMQKMHTATQNKMKPISSVKNRSHRKGRTPKKMFSFACG